MKDGRVLAANELGHPTSIGQFTTVADAGRFADDLWQLLQDALAREVLKKTLMDTYFPNAVAAVQAAEASSADPLEEEAERLTEEAVRVRFRKQPTPKNFRDSDAAFLRHRLFPRVVTRLYSHACAVCRLGMHDTSGRTLVEAAHIKDFALFGSDDPRNGLALCPNHHTGFDAGWFTVTAEYRLKVSRRLSGGVSEYAKEGTRIHTPEDERYVLDPDALAWHAGNKFQRGLR